MREFRARGIGIRFQESNRRHHETGHAERALKTLFVDDALLHRVQRAVGLGEAFDRLDFLVAHGVREHRAGVVRHIVNQHSASAAFGLVAADLRAGKAKLVAQRHHQRLLLHHIDRPLLPIDIQRDQPFAGPTRLREQRGRAEQIIHRRDSRAACDNSFDEGAPRKRLRRFANHLYVHQI